MNPNMNKLVKNPIKAMTENLPIFKGHLNGLLILGSLYLKTIKAKLMLAKVINTNKLVKFATIPKSPIKVNAIHNNINKKIAT